MVFKSLCFVRHWETIPSCTIQRLQRGDQVIPLLMRSADMPSTRTKSTCWDEPALPSHLQFHGLATEAFYTSKARRLIGETSFRISADQPVIGTLQGRMVMITCHTAQTTIKSAQSRKWPINNTSNVYMKLFLEILMKRVCVTAIFWNVPWFRQ